MSKKLAKKGSRVPMPISVSKETQEKLKSIDGVAPGRVIERLIEIGWKRLSSEVKEDNG